MRTISGKIPDMQADWQIGRVSGSTPLDEFSADTTFFNTLETPQSMPFLDTADYDLIGMELLAEPPSFDVQVTRQAAVPFSISSLNDFTASRLLYAIDLIKQAPATMVQKNETPWSHSRLYDDAMPRCLSGMTL
jgi:hypothetical protein